VLRSAARAALDLISAENPKAEHFQKYPTTTSEMPYLSRLTAENMIPLDDSEEAPRMHQSARPTAELRHTLRELLAHKVSNPDDDPHLSGVLFFCATDERTRQLIERIELLASEAFFDASGRAISHRMRAAAVDGVRIKQKHKAPADETVIRIALPDKGYITVSTARL